MKGEPIGSPFLWNVAAGSKYLSTMKPLVSVDLPTKHGGFSVSAFESGVPEQPHLLLLSETKWGDVPMVRVHSECWTGDVVGSLKCDCGPQLQHALSIVGREGGALVYLRQEGRGIGLIEKLKAYNLQDQEGLDTFQANEHLGHQRDERSFEMAAAVLASAGLTKIKLLTNNPEKVSGLENHGIEVIEVVPIQIPPNVHNKRYLKAKAMEASGLK